VSGDFGRPIRKLWPACYQATGDPSELRLSLDLGCRMRAKDEIAHAIIDAKVERLEATFGHQAFGEPRWPFGPQSAPGADSHTSRQLHDLAPATRIDQPVVATATVSSRCFLSDERQSFARALSKKTSRCRQVHQGTRSSRVRRPRRRLHGPISRILAPSYRHAVGLTVAAGRCKALVGDDLDGGGPLVLSYGSVRATRFRYRVRAPAPTGLPATGSQLAQSPRRRPPGASLPDDRSLMNPIVPAPPGGVIAPDGERSCAAAEPGDRFGTN
jgi:hypothetical protein